MNTSLGWARSVGGMVLTLVMIGLGVKEWQTNQVVGHTGYRFNMVVVGQESVVSFVSMDPSDQSILSFTFPPELAIRSRAGGEYSISALYKLGSYTGSGGEFARRKIQGFMRVPIPGYVVAKMKVDDVEHKVRRVMWQAIFGQGETNLSSFDALTLLYRSMIFSWRSIDEGDLIRAGVIADKNYHPDRLKDYVGSRLFDWGIGESRISVAIINASGVNGLGSDMADFLSNLGMDIVMVRSASDQTELERSVWQVESSKDAKKLSYIFENLFGLDSPLVETISGEYRAKVLITVGKDAKELF